MTNYIFVICSLNILTTRLENTPMARDKSLVDLENLVDLGKIRFRRSHLAKAHRLRAYSPIAVAQPFVERKGLPECLE